MKKVVIILVVFICILAMSSAYAVWTDSVDVEVTAESAIINAQFVGRDNPTYISYTVQGQSVSTSNPYSSIEENVQDWYPPNGDNKKTYRKKYRVIYTIKNTGTVPISIDGIAVSNIDVDMWTYAWGVYRDDIWPTMSIVYKLNAGNKKTTVTVTDVENHPSTVTFSTSQKHVLQPNQTGTLTVKYERSETGDPDIDEYSWVDMTITDRLKFSVYK